MLSLGQPYHGCARRRINHFTRTLHPLKKLLLIFVLFFIANSLFAQENRLSLNRKKVLFLGNSITYAGGFVVDIEAYLKLSNPGKEYRFYNLGLPSETVSGLSEEGHANGTFPRPNLFERVDRVLNQIRPDIIFACYGMNDGIYLPFDEQRFVQFKQGVDRLNQKAIRYGSQIIWVTPPIYDERKGKAYANVLDIYADWLLSKQFTEDWKVIDIHQPMKVSLESAGKTDQHFALAKDGIHPGSLGHWIMARPILAYLGYHEVLQFPTPDEAFQSFPNGAETRELIGERQALLKDAWLTQTGHKRPGMKKGLPLNEAKKEADNLDQKIAKLAGKD